MSNPLTTADLSTTSTNLKALIKFRPDAPALGANKHA